MGNYIAINIFLGDGSQKTMNEVTSSLRLPTGQSILRLRGSFTLRGGRITEFFTEDPGLIARLIEVDTNIFFQLSPIRLDIVSLKSFNASQENRIREALGDQADGMINEADVIFQGRAASSRVDLANDYYGRRQVYTFYTIRANEPLKGKVQNPDNFVLQVIGGRIPGTDIAIVTSHQPKFNLDQRYILFLKNYADKIGVVRTRGALGQVSY